jgi:hypothetical protein
MIVCLLYIAEQCNATISKRISGVPFLIDPTAWTSGSKEKRVELLSGCLDRMVSLMNGAPFNRDHVCVSRPEGVTVWTSTGPTAFKLDEKEVRYPHFPPTLNMLLLSVIGRKTSVR